MPFQPHLCDQQLDKLHEVVRRARASATAPSFDQIAAALTRELGQETIVFADVTIRAHVDHVRETRLHYGTASALDCAYVLCWVAGHLADEEGEAHAWGCLGVTLRVDGQLPAALLAHHRAVERFRTLVEQGNRRELRASLARAFYDRGVTHADDDQHAKAEADYGAAHEIYRGLVEVATDHELRGAWAMTLSNRGRARQVFGNLDDALNDLNQAESICREMVEHDQQRGLREYWARALKNRALLHVVGGQLDRAVADACAAEAIYRDLVERQGQQELRLRWAKALDTRGNAYRVLGRLTDAVRDYVEAAAICGTLVVDEDRDEFRDEWAAILTHRAGAYQMLGRLVEAVADYTQAVEIYEDLVQQHDHHQLQDELALARLHRGTAYQLLGRKGDALDDHLAAEQTLRRLVRHEERRELRDELASALESRGLARQASDDLEAALLDYSNAEREYRDLVELEGREELRQVWAGILLSRGEAYQEQGKPDLARADYAKAEEIYQELVRDDGRSELRSRYARALAGLGSLEIARAIELRTSGDVEAAERVRKAALAIIDAAQAEAGDMIEVNWELAWKVHDGLGDICKLADDLPAALEHEEQAIDVLEQVRQRQGSALERSVFLSGKTGAYLDAATLGLTLAWDADDAGLKATYLERAYAALLKLKARDLAEALAEQPLAARLARLPEASRQPLAALLDEADELRTTLFGEDVTGAIDGTRTSIDAAPIVSDGDRRLVDDERLERLRNLDEQVLALQAELILDPAAIAADIVAPTPAALAGALAHGEIVVDILDDIEQPAVFVVSRATAPDPGGRPRAEIAAYPLDRRSFADAAAGITAAQVNVGGRRAESDRMKGALDVLGSALLPAEVADRVRAAGGVFLVPHALTSRLPLLHLPLPDGTPLMTAARLAAVIPSAGLLIGMRGPDTRRTDRIGKTAPDPVLLAVGADAVPRRPLRYVDSEVHGVAQSYDGATVWCHPSNVPGRSYRLDRDGLLAILDAPRWIHAFHLSSHGVVLDPARPESVGLLLHGTDDEARLLTAQEIASRLQAVIDLVVMTSCWSGQVSHGHEANGVTAAFLRGGSARALVVSLWPVEDRTAALFGIFLHQEWRANGGRTIGEAFVRTRQRLAELSEPDARTLLNWMRVAPGLTPTRSTAAQARQPTPTAAPRAVPAGQDTTDAALVLPGDPGGQRGDLTRALDDAPNHLSGASDVGSHHQPSTPGRPERTDSPQSGGPAVRLIDLAAFQLVGDPDLRPWFGPPPAAPSSPA